MTAYLDQPKALSQDSLRQAAHDLRSPLSAIKIILGTLRNVTDEKMHIIQLAVERIEDIASGLLNGSQLITPELTNMISLADLCENIITEKATQYPHHPILLKLSHLPDQNIAINMKPFTRVISNLLQNAIEASPVLHAIQVSIVVGNNELVLSIEDEGCGISEEHMQQLLSHGGSFGKPNGHGLGLSHAIKTIKSMKGSIDIQSQLGLYTKVTIRLPQITA